MTVSLPTQLRPRRAHSRLRLGVPARFLSLDGQQWVTLLNLSRRGAGLVLSASGTISPGMLRWLEFETFGEFAWQRGSAVGLHFDEPLNPAWLLDTRRRAPDELHREAREAARLWVTGRI